MVQDDGGGLLRHWNKEAMIPKMCGSQCEEYRKK